MDVAHEGQTTRKEQGFPIPWLPAFLWRVAGKVPTPIGRLTDKRDLNAKVWGRRGTRRRARAARRAGPSPPNDERDRGDAPTSLGEGPPWMPVSWTATWPLPRAISQRLTGIATTPAITRATARLPQKSVLVRPASIAPGIASRISVVDDLHGRDAERVRGERDRDHRAEREPRAQQGQAGQRVAEEERQADGERDRARLREAERGADDDAR